MSNVGPPPMAAGGAVSSFTPRSCKGRVGGVVSISRCHEALVSTNSDIESGENVPPASLPISSTSTAFFTAVRRCRGAGAAGNVDVPASPDSPAAAAAAAAAALALADTRLRGVLAGGAAGVTVPESQTTSACDVDAFGAGAAPWGCSYCVNEVVVYFVHHKHIGLRMRCKLRGRLTTMGLTCQADIIVSLSPCARAGSFDCASNVETCD